MVILMDLYELSSLLVFTRVFPGQMRHTQDKVSEEHERLKLYVNDLRKRYDDVRSTKTRKQMNLDKVTDSIRDLQRDAVKFVDEDTPTTRHIRMLENRLDKSLIKYNEAHSIRKTYEQIVSRLREERIGFDNQLQAIERTLKAKEHDLEELVLMSHDANHAKDQAKAELIRAEYQLHVERANRDKDIHERRAQVKATQEINAKIAARDHKRAEIKREAQGDLSAQDEKELSAMVLKNEITHENNKKELEARQKRVTNYEDAFQKIKNATGVNDFQEVIQKILSQEGTKANLKNMVKEVQRSIDALQEQKIRERNAMEDIKYSGSGPSGLRKAVDQLEAELSVAMASLNMEKDCYEAAAKALLAVKSAVQQIIDKAERLKVDSSTLPILTDETLSEVLHVCEFRLLKALDLVSNDVDADRGAVGSVDSAFSTMDLSTLSDNNLRISTTLNTEAFGACDDDDLDDDGDEVMDRSTLKSTSLMSSPEPRLGGTGGSKASSSSGRTSRAKRPDME